MVKQLSIALFLGIVVLSAVLFYYFFKGAPSLSNSTTSTSSSSKKEDMANKENILLYVTNGIVSYKSTENTLPTLATTSPVVIPNNTMVITASGTAVVLLPDNSSITLDPNTEITVNYSKEKTSIYQTLGRTYHRVEALVTGAHYQVQTPGTLAAVRGTKFSVFYDKAKKETKVSVTEHKVEVSTTPRPTNQDSTSTNDKPETFFVEEGKTAKVRDHNDDKKKTVSLVTVVDTEKDTDTVLKKRIREELVIDKHLEEEKKTDSPKIKVDTEIIRERIKRDVIKLKDGDGDSYLKEANGRDAKETLEIKTGVNVEGRTEVKTDVKTDDRTAIKKEAVEVAKDATDQITKTEAVTKNIEVRGERGGVKLSEEAFFTKFEPLFIGYFYLDDDDAPCRKDVKAEERVRVVTAFAKENGYPFTKDSLLSFGQEIDSYCSSKDKGVKVKLQARFDDEYPF